MLTTKHWAENLDRCRAEVVRRWGERLYRRFRLYLWGCAHVFETDDVTAYRLLLELPIVDRRGRQSKRRRLLPGRQVQQVAQTL
jgi:cyclopropane-fatty-acyl-phospholipid synthase